MMYMFFLPITAIPDYALTDAGPVDYCALTTYDPILELVEKYISQKTGVRHNTRSNYNFVVNVIKKEAFGQKRIDKIKVSDAKEWLIKMQQIDGRGYSSIHTIRGVVRPAFQMAVDDDLLVKNPFELSWIISFRESEI